MRTWEDDGWMDAEELTHEERESFAQEAEDVIHAETDALRALNAWERAQSEKCYASEQEMALAWDAEEGDAMQLLPDEIRQQFPPLYATEEVSLAEKVIVAKFFDPTSRWTWYAVE